MRALFVERTREGRGKLVRGWLRRQGGEPRLHGVALSRNPAHPGGGGATRRVWGRVAPKEGWIR
ncbi:hypothetical protein D187_000803 [Cystobacter fuscus DSM 2262]|uniref:Uncharacterized protein n=1 Tax=Cystobacter fuscus (strain ATCC 25194 / DSM 2262 / NBRC 100088 / M29) TaxID=1242864 RepID=S9PS71_CYSF2|nr:hypothetical protein D187_000803 [Cystobacter fuscus DSM 2262]